ncbi:MAG TPA: FKBP-type peptidyl-prolyl cis-trans isomerase [Bacteroidia bacterium]|nr:FKBP-type peptidyl-prolyl cis-trans isomerase [Bacteroidia bacterium]
MKKIFFAAGITGAFVFTACEGDKRYPGYEKVDNGTYFLIHKEGTGASIDDTGGLVFVHMKFKTEYDSVFYDINYDQSFPILISAPAFKGDYIDMIGQLQAGDSASFFLLLDSLRANYPGFEFRNPKYDTMQYLGFLVEVDSIYSRQQKTKWVAEKDAEEARKRDFMLKRQAMMGPLQDSARKNEPMLKKKDKQLLKTYLAANNITVKPDAKGIYFQELTPGTGDPLMPGTTVGVLYTGKYLDGSTFDSNEIVPGDELLKFQLGAGTMVPGFESSVAKMKQGGSARFILPPDQAFNDSLTRVFEVKVVELKKPVK